ncbi:TetR/AcrR family transcriptional regulator [Undibacterium sp.]|jgi:AcrR family transcriptional regulator|uniref:TetR/AcrR family transcriptional regulator n=1 Tax=Undibacterium sp. TaxID=1914977 RepID=UPI002B541B2F|nr:TetR/AcrR family transcriptional regulator [Undibacterium sp.]HTD02668.1 TetR/AcrR family transcriptional regulator [Undibacterium sp.]
MTRPSQNIDQRLLDAGFELLPKTGCRGLSVRRLVEHADVNLGMFHYHFKSKDNFIRTLLQKMYEDMFAKLAITATEAQSPLENLRAALKLLGQFGRHNRYLLFRLFNDALAGEAVVTEFFSANIPRHVSVISSLIADAQQSTEIVKVPLPQAVAFLFGSIMAPVLLGVAVLENGAAPKNIADLLEGVVLSEQALNQRIDFALRGLAPG